MARGTAVKEFVSRLRDRFSSLLESADEITQSSISHAFERAVNDTLLGESTEPKPAPKKPRRKRRTKAEIAAAIKEGSKSEL